MGGANHPGTAACRSPTDWHISAKRGTPALPNIVVGVLPIALLMVNLGQAALFTDITGVAVVVVYLAYLGVTVPVWSPVCRPGSRPEKVR